LRFLRVSALNAVAVGMRMVTALALNELLAIFVGPAGYAVRAIPERDGGRDHARLGSDRAGG